MNLIWSGLFFILGYFIGSVPFGYLAGRFRGIDIRDRGSGKTGAANVLRNLGVLPAAIVLFLDAGKGMGMVLLARSLFISSAPAITGAIGVLVGHNFPIYIGFRGGRGLASFLGGFLAFSPLITIIGGAVTIVIIILSRFVSLGSITFVLFTTIMSGLLTVYSDLPPAVFIYSLLGGAFIILQHRDNIARLLSGRERKIKLKLKGGR